MDEVLNGRSWVADGGLETDLIFNKGIDLPDFAAFPLVDDAAGCRLLEEYYAGYARIAAAADAGLVLETPTWRANADWAQRLGYDGSALGAITRRAVDLCRGLADSYDVAAAIVSGVVGPRGDGYIASGLDADEAAAYHAPQIRSLAAAGVDFVHAMTITEPAEAVGITRAAREVKVPVAVSFTVETDGRLPDGSTLREAIMATDAVGGPDWYGINCAHPSHVQQAFTADGHRGHEDWVTRVRSFRPNASTLSHDELDIMTELDPGDLDLLATSASELRSSLPRLAILGGCCGTDTRHVARLWNLQ